MRTLCPRKPLAQRKGGADCETAGVLSDCDADDSVHPKPLEHLFCLLLRENLLASLLPALGNRADMGDAV